MPNTINADNGVVSGITGIRTTADSTGNLALQSNGVTVLTLATNNTATFAGTLTTAAQGIAKASLPTGSVLQVVQANQNGEISTTSTSFINAGGLSVSITPISSSSKIFLLYTGSAGNDGAQGSYLTFAKNGTNLAGGNGGLRIYFSGSSGYHFGGFSMSLLNSPATTSALTYTVQFRTDSGTVYISGANATDTLTAWEIAG